MASKQIKYTKDNMWQVEITAFHINLFVYKAIGATMKVRHKEKSRGFLGLGGGQEKWVERSVQGLRIDNLYEGLLPSLTSGAARRSCSVQNKSTCDCRLWSAGVGISMDANPNTGYPDLNTTMPSAAASLDVRSVTSMGYATINGESVTIGPVSAT